MPWFIPNKFTDMFIELQALKNVEHGLQCNNRPRSRPELEQGQEQLALDPRIQQTVGTNLALEKVLELALQCLAPRRQSRPRMWRCGEILWSIRKDYQELSALDLRSRSCNSQISASVREI
ncbi:hypothetical protein Golax_020485 [Gossypium laxum]|uniref:Uncharacterized protein n=1 Tax=Gossypium laxum TaxID=34288 RepID=A0A7J9B4Q6_9ROSI|nr:hypothetical protein [Gossypium laxum]